MKSPTPSPIASAYPSTPNGYSSPIGLRPGSLRGGGSAIRESSLSPSYEKNISFGANSPTQWIQSTPITLIRNVTKDETPGSARKLIMNLTNSPSNESKIGQTYITLQECAKRLEDRDQMNRSWDLRIQKALAQLEEQNRTKEEIEIEMREILLGIQNEKGQIDELHTDISRTDEEIRKLREEIQRITSLVDRSVIFHSLLLLSSNP